VTTTTTTPTKGTLLMRKSVLLTSTAVGAALLSTALLAGPASAATIAAPPAASAAAVSVQHDFTVTLVVESSNAFSLAGDGAPSATVRLLDAAGTVIDTTTVADDASWSLPGGSLDGFGGTITVQQIHDGTTTQHVIDLASIPPAP
jgi:hypothetical protein